MSKKNIKEVVFKIGDELKIENEDLTIKDAISIMSLLAAVIKEIEKNKPELKISFKEIISVVDSISDDLINDKEKSKENT